MNKLCKCCNPFILKYNFKNNKNKNIKFCNCFVFNYNILQHPHITDYNLNNDHNILSCNCIKCIHTKKILNDILFNFSKNNFRSKSI